MMSASQARDALKDLIKNHLDENDPERVRIESLLEDPARGVPIRGVLEAMPKKNRVEYTPEELDIIEELLYLYG